MWQCHYCRSALPLDVLRKNRLCPGCGGDLHCCKNCVHYDENLSSQCREPNSPWVANREAQNNCGFFEFQNTSQPGETTAAPSDAERAKEAFRALFRNP